MNKREKARCLIILERELDRQVTNLKIIKNSSSIYTNIRYKEIINLLRYDIRAFKKLIKIVKRED